MARTIALLDVPRRELVETPLSKKRSAKNMGLSTGGKNMVFSWPGTGSYTLQPLNITPGFAETNTFESLKLQLSDFKSDPKLWVQAYEHKTAKGVAFDPFYSLVVPADKVPAGYPHTGDSLLQAAVAVGGMAIPQLNGLVNYQNDTVVQLLTSKVSYDYNQGWCVRFYQEGRGSYRRGSVLQFQFGDYLLNLNTSGMAELYQTGDFVTFALVYQFRWCDQSQVHDTHHRIIIFPHARNKIEFLCGNEYASGAALLGPITPAFIGRSGGGLYEVPGELVYDPTGKRFIITAAAPIGVYCSLEFRPYLQVSKLGFTNGSSTNDTPGHAFLFDAPITLTYPPLVDFRVDGQYDLNGGTLEFGLYDPISKKDWAGGKGFKQIQLAAVFYGTAANDTLPSLNTPEFYGYSIRKDALFTDITRTTVAAFPKSTSLTKGESADSERCTLTLDNMDGQVEGFVDRSDCPILVYDADTNVILFEGQADFDGTDNFAETFSLKIEARGMAADLARCHWTELAPDFGHDPDDKQGRGYFWSEAVYYSFEVSGVSRDRVIIEDIEEWNFRLPAQTSTSGAQGKSDDKGDKGDGHVDGGQNGLRWQPKWDSTPYEFLDYLLRAYLHWDFAYNYQDRCWHVFKRPLPTDKTYKDLKPKAVFIRETSAARTYAAQNTGLPVYTHSNMKYKNSRPKATTVVVQAMLSESRWKSKEELAQALKDQAAGGGDPNDSNFVTELRKVECILDNPQGYPNPNNTKGYQNNPDWLGHRRVRQLPVLAPNRESLAFIACRAYWDHCFGQQTRTFDASWGDATTAYFRKWDLVYIDTGRNSKGIKDGSLEKWWIQDIQPSWAHDSNRRAGYHVIKWRLDIPPPF